MRTEREIELFLEGGYWLTVPGRRVRALQFDPRRRLLKIRLAAYREGDTIRPGVTRTISLWSDPEQAEAEALQWAQADAQELDERASEMFEGDTEEDAELARLRILLGSGQWVAVESSNVNSYRYLGETGGDPFSAEGTGGGLEIDFIGHRVYRYPDLQLDEAADIVWANSKGGWVWSALRIPGRDFRKLSGVTGVGGHYRPDPYKKQRKSAAKARGRLKKWMRPKRQRP